MNINNAWSSALLVYNIGSDAAGIIPDSIYCTMKQELDELCRFAYKVMMLNIKNLRSDHANVIALIEQNLLKMQQTERKCYQRFLSLLDLF